MNVLSEIVHSVIARGDLAHLALALWAATSVAIIASLLRELSAANRRFDDFVRELALFNRRHDPVTTDPFAHHAYPGGET